MKTFFRFRIIFILVTACLCLFSVRFVNTPATVPGYVFWFAAVALIALWFIFTPLASFAVRAGRSSFQQWMFLFLGILVCINLVTVFGGGMPTFELLTDASHRSFWLGLHLAYALVFITCAGCAYVWNLSSHEEEEE